MVCLETLGCCATEHKFAIFINLAKISRFSIIWQKKLENNFFTVLQNKSQLIPNVPLDFFFGYKARVCSFIYKR